jgi:hypothetical protein
LVVNDAESDEVVIVPTIPDVRYEILQ